MVDEQLAHAIFVECTRRVALDRYASKAHGKDQNFELEFTGSQLARDGLASAAGIFARAVAPHLMRKDEILSLAMTYAEKAPIETWWRPRFLCAQATKSRDHEAPQAADAALVRSN